MATRGERWRRVLRRSVFLLVCGTAVATPAAREFRTAEFESLKVTIDSDWALRSAPGYLPVRFDITNEGEARVIDIVGQGSRVFRGPRGGGLAQTSVRQAVRLAKGDRVRLTIPVPVFADSESFRFEIREGDRTLERFNYNGFQSHVAPADASALIVASPGSGFGTIAGRLARTITGRGGGGFVVALPGGGVVSTGVGSSGGPAGGGPSLDFVLDPSRLPANWLGYTSLRAVVIGPTEWEQLSDGQKSALLTWTACGGDLIFVDGALNALLPSAQGEAASDPDRVVGRHFLGRVHALKSATLATAGLNNVLLAADKSRELHWALPANSAPDWGVIAGRGFRLRIPGVEGVPARVYLVILVLFSLLIGPANYWFLWRKRRQVLLVLTAPLISATFIVLLVGYAVGGEGLRVQGRALTFTMLDQASRQAATRASVSLYAAGMAPAGGLRFARDVAVFPIGPDGTGTRDLMSLDLTDAQRFVGGVLHARSPTNFEQIAFRTARERLTFSHEAGGLTVTNGLEASIAALFYREGDTVYRLDGPLASGGQHTLSGRPAGAPLELPAHVTIPSKLVDLFQNLPRDSYLAVLDQSPFWDPGVSGLVERGSLHVVLGWPEGRR